MHEDDSISSMRRQEDEVPEVYGSKRRERLQEELVVLEEGGFKRRRIRLDP